ncbi:MAG: response regulator [Anaerolineae bacterium]
MAEKILVVDDDFDSLKLIGLMLQRNGYDVVAANTGTQALQKAAEQQPDLIILDVMMPDMNGYEVCRRLRRSDNTKLIPIIMFTAKTLIDDKVAGFEAGADDYLTKPTHPAELASRVRAILLRSAAQRQTKQGRGMTIGIFGAKGGVGTTTVALNIAASRLLAGQDPIVTDFRLGAGSLGLALGLGDSQGLVNVLGQPPEEIRPRTIETEIATHSSGLRALLSSAHAKEVHFTPHPEAAAAVIRALRGMGTPIVADLGTYTNPLFMRLQREMDQLIMVLDPITITLAMAREQLQEIDVERPQHRGTYIVIVNRAASGSPLSWNEVERILGREVRANISLASELTTQSLIANVPVVMLQPTAIVSSQIIKLSEDLNNIGRLMTTREASA